MQPNFFEHNLHICVSGNANIPQTQNIQLATFRYLIFSKEYILRLQNSLNAYRKKKLGNSALGQIILTGIHTQS